jgi:hypothetical protein
MAKKAIYQNLKKCSFHIQGCLIAEDGRHLKLDSESIILWARAMVYQNNCEIYYNNCC